MPLHSSKYWIGSWLFLRYEISLPLQNFESNQQKDKTGFWLIGFSFKLEEACIDTHAHANHKLTTKTHYLFDKWQRPIQSNPSLTLNCRLNWITLYWVSESLVWFFISFVSYFLTSLALLPSNHYFYPFESFTTEN